MSESRTPSDKAPSRGGALRLRWLEGTWRRTALVHGFDEVDALARTEEAPTSGEAIDLSAQASRRLLGADAGSQRLFSIRPWVESDRPQRGRPPEFWLFSCRIFADEGIRADAEVIACAVESLRALGLTSSHVKIRISHRDAVRSLLVRRGVDPEQLDAWFPLLHRVGKMSNDDFISGAMELGMESKTAVDVLRILTMSTPFEAPTTQLFLSEQAGGRGPEYFKALFADLRAMGVADWCVLNLGIVRGGTHHTGMVFEVHDTAGHGRSIAGGGRSEFESGGTVHAVGFDMGDTALLELLRESALLPGSAELAERLGARTDAFVAAIDDAGASAAVVPTVATLRRANLRALGAGEPMGSMKEAVAASQGARRVVLIESGIGPGAARVLNTVTGAEFAGLISLDRLVQALRT